MRFEQDYKKATYRLRINTAHAVGFFLLAVGFWYLFHKTGVPHFLVGTGWFLRSGMHKADETDATIKEADSVEDSQQ